MTADFRTDMAMALADDAEALVRLPPRPLFDLHLNAGVRALLAVPLLHQDEVIGALVVRRKRAGAFADDTVSLLQSFAAQSAIAIPLPACGR